MTPPSSTQTSLFVILARVNSVAVIFRRGPSKRVKLIKWHSRSDKFEHGQWFKGRIYERRSDLSPSGEKLVYFAANHKKPIHSWTAVSRPPYLTALGLWPKGDCWGGGGLFETDNRLLINHPSGEMKADHDHRPEKNLRVAPFGDSPGGEEDLPVWQARMKRDGWIFQAGTEIEHPSIKSPIWITIEPPHVFSKFHPQYPKHDHCLQLLWQGIKERDGAWYVISHNVISNREIHLDLGRSDWADWDRNGDLLFAREGKLFRLSPSGKRQLSYELAEAREIADFTGDHFEVVAPPPEATRW